MGIKTEDIGKLFSEYSQLDTRARRHIEGTGLGLAITKKQCELMRGRIWVESEYNVGSVFTAIIVQERVEGAASVLGKQTAQELEKKRWSDKRAEKGQLLVRTELPGVRVLAVDDVMINCEVIRGLLLPYQIETDFASSGQDAINIIQKGNPKYDIVFVDHMMPGMDGIETITHIRNLAGDYARNVKLIAFTANATTDARNEFSKAGCDDFLAKPIDIFQLNQLLKTHFPGGGPRNSAHKARATLINLTLIIVAPAFAHFIAQMLH
jgi:CheY-like chemotaxis protein